MNLAKKLFDFYINSSIHVALAVCALVRITELYLDVESNSIVNYFIFFATITGYNFVKYAGIAKLHHRSLTDNLKIIQVFSLISFCLLVYFGCKLTLKSVLWMLPFAVLTTLYAVPFSNGLTKNLRNIPSLKIIIIGLVWAGVTVLFSLIDKVITMDVNVFLMFIQRLLFVIVLTLPFDIRDVKFDVKELQTIPQKIGVAQTKKLGFVLLGFTLVLEFLIAPNPNFRTAFLIVFSILLVFLQRATEQQKKYYASFWVEAIPIFWLILLLLFK